MNILGQSESIIRGDTSAHPQLCLSAQSPITHVDILISQLEAIKQSVDRQIIRLTKQRNAMAPINKLPTELSIDILEASLSWISRSDSAWEKRLHELSTVQTRWWQQITARASLWTQFRARDPLRLTQLKVERSRDAMIDVDCGEDLPDDYVDRIWPIVLSRAHRWRTFRFRHDTVLQRLPTLRVIAPALEELEIEDYNDQSVIDLAGCNQLRRLELCQVTLENWGVLRHLTSIRINTVSVSSGFDAQIWKALCASPHLENLSMEDIEGGSASGPELQPSAAIHLPRLANLYLANSPLSTTLLLQRSIRAENVTDFHVSHRDGGDEIFADLVRPRGRKPSPLSQAFKVAGVNWAMLSIGPPGHELWLEGSVDSLCTVTAGVNIELTTFMELAPLLPFAGSSFSHPIQLHCMKSREPVDNETITLFDLLNVIPNVTELHLSPETEHAIPVFEFLAEPQEDDDEWPCPELKEIVIRSELDSRTNEGDWEIFMAHLAQMVESRSNSGAVPVRAQPDLFSCRAKPRCS